MSHLQVGLVSNGVVDVPGVGPTRGVEPDDRVGPDVQVGVGGLLPGQLGRRVASKGGALDLE